MIEPQRPSSTPRRSRARARPAVRDDAAETSDRVFLHAALSASPDRPAAECIGTLAVIVRSPDFEELSRDRDLAQTIRSARTHGDDVVVFLFERRDQSAVFYRDGRPSAGTRDGGLNREAVTPSSDRTRPRVRFQLGTLTADDGSPLAAYTVVAAD